MTWKARLACVAFGTAAAVAMGQQATTTTGTQTTQTTTQNPDGSTTTVTVTGEVVRYEPGKTIVIRDPNKGTVTYTLEPSLTVPADVQVGRRVLIYTEPGDGAVRVQRITTVTTSSPSAPSMSSESPAPMTETTTTTRSGASSTMAAEPAGQTSQTVESTKTTRTTTVSGTVQAYEPGQSITVVGPGKKVTTYTITQESKLPQDVAIGKQVTVQTTVVSGKPVVRSVQYKTTTKTTNTKTKSVSRQ